MTAERHPILDLPFVADRKRNEPGRLPRNFWKVGPAGDYDITGSYTADCKTGRYYALAYLRWLRVHRAECSGGFLATIVADMPSDLTGIEVGFLAIIDHAAEHGLDAAERLVAYWERWAQNEASKKRPPRRRPKLRLVVNNGVDGGDAA
jgi:hypothetical protein